MSRHLQATETTGAYMINLPIKKLQPGMVTAQSIYNTKGASYLTRGTAVSEQYITRLKKLGVSTKIGRASCRERV